MAGWASPTPELLASTPAGLVSGYALHDRDPIEPTELRPERAGAEGPGEGGNALGTCTLLGDAAHPMSPFKGQGANQAIIDAVDVGAPRRRWLGI